MQKFKEKFLSVFPDFKTQLLKTFIGFTAIILFCGVLAFIKMNADFPAMGLFIDALEVFILVLGSYQLGDIILSKIRKK